MVVIYGLFNKVSGKAYIGSTASKHAKRYREHRCLLRGGKHTSPLLQADWNRYRETNFEIRILQQLDNVSFETRKKAEQTWIETFDRQGLLYNAYKVAFSMPAEVTRLGIEASRHAVGRRWLPETNEKRRLAQLGKPKGHGAKISATKRAQRAARMLADEIV